MARLIIWIAWLICLLLLCVVQSRRVILTPQFGFIACFIPQAIFLLYFVDAWNVKFCDATMYVLLGGVTLFFLTSVSYSWAYMKAHRINDKCLRKSDSTFNEPINLNRHVLIVFFIIHIAIIILMLYYLFILMPGGSLIEKIAFRSYSLKFDDPGKKMNVPFLVSQLQSVFQQSGYIWGYLLAHSIVLKYKKNRLLLWLNMFACVLNMFLGGNRAPFLNLLVAVVVQGYFIWGRATGWARGIKIKTVFRMLVAGFLVLGALYWTMNWFGRKTNYDIVGYLGEYLAAPLKNLDSFIREGDMGHHFVHSRTFRNVANGFGRLFHKLEWQYSLVNPTRFIHGASLGNVYTAFFCYLYDGGYLGCALLVILMALISQRVFLKSIYGRKKPQISLVIIVYSYMFQEIVFSFFFDFFFATTFSFGMIKSVLIWWLLREVFTRFKFVSGKDQYT